MALWVALPVRKLRSRVTSPPSARPPTNSFHGRNPAPAVGLSWLVISVVSAPRSGPLMSWHSATVVYEPPPASYLKSVPAAGTPAVAAMGDSCLSREKERVQRAEGRVEARLGPLHSFLVPPHDGAWMARTSTRTPLGTSVPTARSDGEPRSAASTSLASL